MGIKKTPRTRGTAMVRSTPLWNSTSSQLLQIRERVKYHWKEQNIERNGTNTIFNFASVGKPRPQKITTKPTNIIVITIIMIINMIIFYCYYDRYFDCYYNSYNYPVVVAFVVVVVVVIIIITIIIIIISIIFVVVVFLLL